MSAKRIIINGKFLTQRVTGVQRYARELLVEVDKQLEGFKGLSIVLAVQKGVKDIPTYNNIEVKEIGPLKGIMWEQIALPLYAIGKGITLNLCNVSPILQPGIVCIHDMRIKARTQDYSKSFVLWYNLLLGNATKRAKRIITVSEFSKKEIMRYYRVPRDKIQVIPNAWQHFDRVACDETTLEKYGLFKGGYFFSMSSLEPNKNLKWIVEVAKRTPSQLFVVAGGINKRVFSGAMGYECPDNVKLIGYVTDEEAKTLMRDCLAFLFPTFYEGFGIPPLEAMVTGCKNVVVSNTETMHEIFGDSVTYIDPNEYILEIDENTQQSRRNIERFSWERSATLLLSLIMEIYKGGGRNLVVVEIELSHHPVYSSKMIA